MFKRKTVFILGAGASWHYGYPTGEKLVHLVIDQARELASFCRISAEARNAHLPYPIKQSGGVSDERRQELWQGLQQSALELAKRLEQVNPTLIDYFLAQNHDLQEIGKLVIAMVILRREKAFNITKTNSNRQIPGQPHAGPIFKSGDDWLRFVLYKLAAYCDTSSDIMKNQICFVTFNYDTSLERRLLQGLGNISHFRDEDVLKFLDLPRILHVYGKIREPLGEPPTINFPLPSALSRSVNVQDRQIAQATIDACFLASKGIYTIDGKEKETGADILSAARKAIAEAEVLYILGYGFDDSNNRRLNLQEILSRRSSSRTTMLTNLGGLARVSKAASRLLFGRPERFSSLVHQENPLGDNGATMRFYWEMSTKNCYDALAEDFESLEE